MPKEQGVSRTITFVDGDLDQCDVVMGLTNKTQGVNEIVGASYDTSGLSAECKATLWMKYVKVWSQGPMLAMIADGEAERDSDGRLQFAFVLTDDDFAPKRRAAAVKVREPQTADEMDAAISNLSPAEQSRLYDLRPELKP